MIIIETLDELKARVKEVTAKAAGTSREKLEDSPLVTVIREQVGKVDSDLAPIFSALVKAIEGRDVVFSSDDTIYTYPRLSAVVPLEQTDGHDYPLHKAFIVSDKDEEGQAQGGIKIDPDDCKGNIHYGEWRYATDAEIDELFDSFTEPEDTVLGWF